MTAPQSLKAPPTPWEVIVRKFFDGEAPEPSVFAQKYDLDKAEVEAVFSGSETRLSQEICAALSRATHKSADTFSEMSASYHRGLEGLGA